jgi:RHS repeat-associated protein
MRAVIQKEIAAAKDETTILQDLAIRYGVQVLAAPPTRGFDLTVWLLPAISLLGGITSVSQSGQSRSYTYDGLGRLTGETNPESGATAYTYDTDSTCGTSHGDLVKKVDAVGNVICYAYDALHRLTAVTYPSGSYASVTPAKHFVYDSATVDGVAMQNAKGRLAEAYTCTGSCTSKVTDLGYSYSKRGDVVGVYESTPNSGGYYVLAASYYANRLVDTLSGVGLPTLTYSPDGEGRIYSVGASSGQNPLASTQYNAFGLPTSVTLGSSDADTFSYDANTGRMTQYTFTVNGSTDKGTLTWNTNGTLKELAITDALNSSNSQTCNYSYDALARLSGANCGSVWSQTFSADAFGNLTKSGTISFQPTYNTSTNQVAKVANVTPGYDANGNLTSDGVHTYNWDADGNVITIDTIGLTYDAMDRMVEQNRSGSYTQIVYGPGGGNLALMSRQTLSRGFVPLVAGDKAVYNSSGLVYYRHADWLGSSRLASTTSRTVYYDGAYAPYGENYTGTGTADISFTGQDTDTVSSGSYLLYDFLVREYHPTWGRWVNPNPAGLAAANPQSPQSWNRYAYVVNNPLALIDPFGLDNVPCGHWLSSGCTPVSTAPPPYQTPSIDGGAPVHWSSPIIGSSESTGVCTSGDCDFPAAVASPKPGNQGTYYPVWGVNGMVYMSPNDGELSDESVEELHLPSLDGSDPAAGSDPGPGSVNYFNLVLTAIADLCDTNGRHVNYVLTTRSGTPVTSPNFYAYEIQSAQSLATGGPFPGTTVGDFFNSFEDTINPGIGVGTSTQQFGVSLTKPNASGAPGGAPRDDQLVWQPRWTEQHLDSVARHGRDKWQAVPLIVVAGVVDMISKRALILRVSLGFLVFLAGWALLAAIALYRTHKTRIEAGEFLGDLVQLQVGKSELRQVTPLVSKYHGVWRKGTTRGAGSPCGVGASVVDFTFENRWLRWFLFASFTRFGATIYVKDNCVCLRSMGIFTAVDGVIGVYASFHVSEFRESPFPRPFSVHLNPRSTLITMDVRATTAERTAAYAVNLDCLAKLRGCKDTREIVPAMWQNSREVAPTYWKTQWDE